MKHLSFARHEGILLLVLTLLLLVGSLSLGQQAGVLLLKEGLAIASAPGFQETVTLNDPVQESIVRGTWTPPAAGAVIQYNDTARGVWEVMKVDSQGWFQHSSLRNGYAYFSYEADKNETVILEAMGHSMVYVNGVPRAGNPYQSKETFESWEPRFDYGLIPIVLVKGKNEFLFQCSRSLLKVKLWKPGKSVFLNTRDLTTPDLIADELFDTRGAVVVVNASSFPLRDCTIIASVPGGERERTAVPLIQPLSVRKVGFRIRGKASAVKGPLVVRLALSTDNSRTALERDTASIFLRVVAAAENHKETFLSSVDGSVQYYSINPARSNGEERPAALFLSLHGAGVEALNQSASYYPKTWGHIVSPTNRRPYGYNWEDWGRIDALEVLDIVTKNLSIDESRIYLTGHSMGGHGVYHIGALFPDRFAAIGPSAGWISFWTYRVRQSFENPSPMRRMLMRATLQSDTYALAPNYSQLGLYILHGAKDDNVLPEQSHLIVEQLSKFHKDFIYHEEEGAGHWWDNSGEPGTDCVDWPPMFDFFARHARPGPGRVRQIDFVTPNPGVSSRDYWVSIEAQQEQLRLSSVSIRFDPGVRRFIGSTRNVERLALDLSALLSVGPVRVELDSQKIAEVPWPHEGAKIWLERQNGTWSVIGVPSASLKGPHRYGTFKDVIRNRVVFVYGTKGTEAENRWAFEKSRFDAERFWYQGNGSIEVVPDVDFQPGVDVDRNVVLYGNAETNAAWRVLLRASPVRVERNAVTVGNRKFTGGDLSCVFIRPRPGSDNASVGVVSGSGIVGMRLADRLPYMLPGVGFPDCVVVAADILRNREDGVRAAGVFGLDWSVERGEFVWGVE